MPGVWSAEAPARLTGNAGPSRTFQLAQTMRELRFGRHCVAVQAAGMGPLEAILSGPAGEWNVVPGGPGLALFAAALLGGVRRRT